MVAVSEVQLASGADHHGFHVRHVSAHRVFAGEAAWLMQIGIFRHLVDTALAVGFTVFVEHFFGRLGKYPQLVMNLIKTDDGLGRVELLQRHIDHLAWLGRGKRLDLNTDGAQQQRPQP